MLCNFIFQHFIVEKKNKEVQDKLTYKPQEIGQ